MAAMRNRVLHLTSPLMQGDDIKALQVLLNEYGHYHGEMDGQYGPLTAQAVYRAKYWFGYPTSKCTQTAESRGLLVKLLTCKEKPTPAMVNTAKKRRAAVPAKSIGAEMLDEAFKWVGTKESPAGSNNVKFSRWYGLRGPWCDMLVTYCGVTVGSKAFNKPTKADLSDGRWAYVPYTCNAAKAGQYNLVITKKPIYGDLVTYDWDNDGTPDHIGFFEKWIVPGQSFSTVEGNTGHDSNSNGGEVQHKQVPNQRYMNDVFMFIHVTG